MRKLLGCIVLLIALTVILSFKYSDKEKINWISIAQLNELYAKNPKPVLIDIYTDWCGWCKEMDQQRSHAGEPGREELRLRCDRGC